jgi:hypothetical protein
MIGYGFLDEMAKVAGFGNWMANRYDAEVSQPGQRFKHRLKNKGVLSAFLGGPIRDLGHDIKGTFKGDSPWHAIGGEAAEKRLKFQKARTEAVEKTERD